MARLSASSATRAGARHFFGVKLCVSSKLQYQQLVTRLRKGGRPSGLRFYMGVVEFVEGGVWVWGPLGAQPHVAQPRKPCSLEVMIFI